MNVVVQSNAQRKVMIDWGGGPRRAAVGSAGIGAKRAEGDSVTPAGTFALRRVLFRADRLERPKTSLPLAAIGRNDGWCDDSNDSAYNRSVKVPYRANAEALWREDHLYDLIVILGFNDEPVVAGAGSAIFLHIAQPNFGPTQGCIALALNDLLELVALLGPGDTITIKA